MQTSNKEQNTMNTNHTTGPWAYEVDAHGRGRIKCGDAWLATTWTTTTHGDNASPHPAEANARLIAAAPDLLATLVDAHDIIDAIGQPETAEVAARMRATIAKARGDE